MNRIINFHEVDDIRWFEEVVLFLKSNYTIVGIEALEKYYSGGLKGKKICHITVDDGHRSFYDTIFPVLKKHNVPASLFVSPKMFLNRSNYWFQEMSGFDPEKVMHIISEKYGIPFASIMNFNVYSVLKSLSIQEINEVIRDYRERYSLPAEEYVNMSVEELMEVHKSGLVEIGAHTMNHPILYNESNEGSKYEIAESVMQLSSMLNSKVRYFAFPNGIPNVDFSKREKEYLKNAGVKLAFSMQAKNFNTKDDVFSIPRIGVTSKERLSLIRIKLLLSHYWQTLMNIKPNGEFTERAALRKISRRTVF